MQVALLLGHFHWMLQTLGMTWMNCLKVQLYEQTLNRSASKH